MIQTATSAVPIPADVLAFAAAQGVSAELPAVVAMTQRVFPEATLNVALESDPEIPDCWQVLIEAQNVGMTVDEALAASDSWHRGIFSICPATHVWPFCLSVQGVQ